MSYTLIPSNAVSLTSFKFLIDRAKFLSTASPSIMNADFNPLKNIPDLQTRHLVLQVLAWMWCIVFAIIVGSWTAFGISAVVHVLLLAAIAITVGTFETARRNPQYFGGLGRGNGGEHE